MPLTIRQANENDFSVILALIQEFAVFQKTPEKVYVTLDQMKEDKDVFRCKVAEVDGVIVGFATYFFAYYSWSGKAVYLDDLYVQEKFRAQNIGVSLLKEIIDTARNEKCKKVRWQVSSWNENAIGFYEKMGAVIDRIEINCDLSLQ
ncbi:GNAT family N-acetyltransferase [Pinibacter aurantiacus]|uniref:GNAT family N-acetyltransferase n=1 Tax=Pinibacter aurantiacus TaxID=2851599 RepID=A0A9E2W3Z0_9BACT|nr:GNAT family N-acetyltransferase [Pinibacter aurantiacus]MBV4356823.1 GNAT family N-acetyltransferase [Pinibacter aurantiacus]